MKVMKVGTKVTIEFDIDEIEYSTYAPKNDSIYLKCMPGALNVDIMCALDGVVPRFKLPPSVWKSY